MSAAAENYHSRFFVKQLEGIAARLRDVADQVEREATLRETPYIDGTPKHAIAAEQVIHAVTWGVANLNLSGLVHDAAQADALDAKGES